MYRRNSDAVAKGGTERGFMADAKATWARVLIGASVPRVSGRRILSKCGQHLDAISVAYGENTRVERDQAHAAATGKC
jgi:hypothetical protein